MTSIPKTAIIAISLSMLFGLAGQAFADCASDKSQAINLIQNLKSTAAKGNDQANASSQQLSQLIESMSSQNCSSELLDVYRTMQREGISAN